MFAIKKIIYSLFGTYYANEDTNKDINGKGTFERYNEIIGQDIDSVILPHIRDIVKDNLNPEELLIQFLVLGEESKGVGLVFFSIEKWRRKTLKYFTKWVRIKGTLFCWELMFAMIGLEVTIVFSSSYHTFDDTTFDDPNRVFDMHCNNCVEYTLHLKGSRTLDIDLQDCIDNIVNFNEPINANLIGQTYTH